MPDHEKLAVLLPADLAKTVREAVDGERYLVESDVVIDALNDWKVKQAIRADKLAQLRKLVEDGIASGFEPIAADEFDRIKREGRALHSSRASRG